MTDVTRRGALKMGALGIAGMAAVDLTAGCKTSRAATRVSSSPSPSPSVSLSPFVADTSSGASTGLPKRAFWASTADTEFFLDFGKGMKAACEARGVLYRTATSGDDPSNHVKQMSQALETGLGVLAFQPLDPTAEATVLKGALDKGVNLAGIITAPCTLQIAASQYEIGYNQGKAAADYAVAHLGGKAEVIYFNLDTVAPQLVVRHQGVLAGLKTGGPGIRVVSDLTVADISTESGFKTMSTALQAHPDISIVLGGDTVVVGAYHALKQAGKLKDDMYLAGVDGDSEALSLVKAGGPYRASTAFAWKLMGYGVGAFGADWIAGKQIPRVLVAKGVLLDSAAAVDALEAANADPGAVFADRAHYEQYLPMLGNTSYAMHEDYWKSAYTPS